MKTPPCHFAGALLGLALFLGISNPGSAAILAIDFNDDTLPVLTQTGFSAYAQVGSPGTRTYATSIGSLDVTISGHQTAAVGGFFDRGAPLNSGAFTYSDLYRDFAFTNVAGPITLSITGVQPNTPYVLTFWSSDRFDATPSFANGATNLITPIGTTSGSIGSITFDRTVNATSNFQHSFTGVYQTSSNTLTFTIQDATTAVNRLTRLNGFMLTPEPSAATLIGLGALGLLLRRRR